ncbi:MAG: Two component signal transduction histidine kinase [Propionibacteriaceae bacterium]|nr:Two component signal transduction histidine kinase [Propionibacteriaceae bacterium]
MIRPGRRTTLTLAAVTVGLLLLGNAAAVATPGWLSGDRASADWATLSFAPPVLAFAVVGGLITWRRPDNTIGWLLSAIGALFALVVASSSISSWALRTRSLPEAVGEWISVGSNGWVIALGLIGTQLPLRLPDGRLPSPRWRWFSWATIALIVVSLVGMSALPGPVEGVAGTSGPLAAEWAQPLAAAFLLVIASFVAALASLILRYRRATAHDRAQLRWVAFGGGFFLVVYLVTAPNSGGDSPTSTVVTAVAQLAFGALPVAIGYAMLRHDLYDIDIVINRTLVYGTLTLVLAVSYFASVLLLRLVLSPLTGESDLAVAASTLAVAALFRPLRSRIQATVDRRFYRSRYDATRILEVFSDQLRHSVDLDAIDTDLRDVVNQTMQPKHLSLWLPGGS